MASAGSPAAMRAALATSLGILAILVVGLLLWWLTRPPQIGGDEEAAKAVDALFTAVTARDERLLGQCEQRLHAVRDAGKLPTDASDYLDGIIQKARAGRWEPAAERLYDFMKAQRPEERRNRSKKAISRAGSGAN